MKHLGVLLLILGGSTLDSEVWFKRRQVVSKVELRLVTRRGRLHARELLTHNVHMSGLIQLAISSILLGTLLVPPLKWV